MALELNAFQILNEICFVWEGENKFWNAYGKYYSVLNLKVAVDVYSFQFAVITNSKSIYLLPFSV